VLLNLPFRRPARGGRARCSKVGASAISQKKF